MFWKNKRTVVELKIHLKCYSDIVQISFQAVTPNPHTETYLNLNLERKGAIKKKNREIKKDYNFFMSSWAVWYIHVKKTSNPLKFQLINPLWHLINGRRKLPAWNKVRPIDCTDKTSSIPMWYCKCGTLTKQNDFLRWRKSPLAEPRFLALWDPIPKQASAWAFGHHLNWGTSYVPWACGSAASLGC